MLRGRKEGGGIKYDNLTVTDYIHHLPNNDINYVTGAGPGESHTDLTVILTTILEGCALPDPSLSCALRKPGCHSGSLALRLPVEFRQWGRGTPAERNVQRPPPLPQPRSWVGGASAMDPALPGSGRPFPPAPRPSPLWIKPSSNSLPFNCSGRTICRLPGPWLQMYLHYCQIHLTGEASGA